MQPKIITHAGREWLALPDEGQSIYTNWGDGRKGDASALVARVNGDPALGLGHCDWRLPTIDELKTLVGAEQGPGIGVFWSSTPFEGASGLRVSSGSNYAWAVGFGGQIVSHEFREIPDHVRLVRASK